MEWKIVQKKRPGSYIKGASESKWVTGHGWSLSEIDSTITGQT